jgi:hypothetical protein
MCITELRILTVCSLLALGMAGCEPSTGVEHADTNLAPLDAGVTDMEADEGVSAPSFCETIARTDDPGFLGVRRLNRSAYDNSVSHLFGVYLRPSENFPADEIEEGFDNIASAQSLAPIHFESYHDAIDGIIEGPLKAPEQPINVRYEAEDLRGTSPSGTETGTVSDGGLQLKRLATLSSPNSLLFTPGRYVVRFRAAGRMENVLSRPRVLVRVGSQPTANVVEVDAAMDQPMVYEIMLDVEEELGQVQLQFINGFNSNAAFLPFHNQMSQCVVDNTMPDSCVEMYGAGSVCVKGSCRQITGCQTTDQCGHIGPGSTCEGNSACRTAGHQRCCLRPGPQRRWLFIDWFEIQSMAPPETNPLREALKLCDPSDTSVEACARKIFSTFGRRAWRRSLTGEELDRLMVLLTLAEQENAEFDTAIDLGLKAIMLSPNFLFRVEIDAAPNTLAVHALSNYELATRLSYFLWNSTPDDILLDLAETGTLNDDMVLEGQVERMLQDQRALRLHMDFGRQWLQTRALKTVQPSTTLFPEFDEGLRAAIMAEADAFFATFQRENRDIRELITADHTFINDRLAVHYGMAPIGSHEMVETDMSSTGRRGIFGQAGFLTLTSELDHTSVVKRGKWVLEQLLCSPPPPPPPDVEGFSEGVDPSAPLKERMAQHRLDPSCAGCHREMDNLGFPFEHFDPIGRYREQDAFGNQIDARGHLPAGQQFDGPVELGEVVVGEERFTHCVTEKLLTYAVGRSFGLDFCQVQVLTDEWSEDDYGFENLIRRIVMNSFFRTRRGQVCEE